MLSNSVISKILCFSALLVFSCGMGDSYIIKSAASYSKPATWDDDVEHYFVRNIADVNNIAGVFDDDELSKMANFIKEEDQFIIVTLGLEVTSIEKYKGMIYVSSVNSDRREVYVAYVQGPSSFAYKFAKPE